jgi:hypothetical protein
VNVHPAAVVAGDIVAVKPSLIAERVAGAVAIAKL